MNSREIENEHGPGLITGELAGRRGRAADYAAENRALVALTETLAGPATATPERLAQAAMDLCRAGSAGVSVLREEGGSASFDWLATAGAWKPRKGGRLPADSGPCAIALERRAPQLFRHPERHYPSLATGVPLNEALLVPLVSGDRAVGVLWVILHDSRRQFDAEDARLLTSLGAIASAALARSEPDGGARETRPLGDGEGVYRQVLDALPVAVYMTDAEGRLTNFNQAAIALSGRVPQLGSDQWCVSWKLYRPDGSFLPHDECPMAVALREGREIRGEEIVIEQPDGRRLRAAAYPMPLRDGAGAVVGGLNVLLDTTDGKRADEAQALLAEIVRASGDAIVSKTLDGTVLSWNRGAEQIFGYTAGEAVGKPIDLIIPVERRHEERSILDRMGKGERIEYYETERVAKDGRRIDVSLTVSPVRDQAGRIIGASKVARDITEQKVAEERLRASEERYRRLAELLPVGVYTCEAPDGVITYYNEQAEALWGRSPRIGDTDQRFCGSLKLFLPDGTFVPPEKCPMAVALREGRSFRNEEVIIERPDGSRVRALVNIDTVRDRHGRIAGAVNVFHDVSALKEAERELREQKENLQTLLDTLPVAVMIADDPECRRISGNPAAARLLRMPAGSNMSKTAGAGVAPGHFRLRLNGREVADDALPVQRAARGEIVEGDEIEQRFDGGDRNHTIVSAQPLYDPHGRPRGAVAALLDVTQLKQAEESLREADRRKDQFLAVLGHELRNPLAPLRTGIELLNDAASDPDLVRRVCTMMQRQLRHLVRLVDDLLDVSRISRGRLELQRGPFDLFQAIEGALELTRPLLEERKHELLVATPEEALPMDGDCERLTQVIGNLLSNAAKYMDAGGTVTLTTEVEGDDVVVRVTDTGFGIPAEQLETVFEMFGQVPEHRARMVEGGLGIGLALSRQLVVLHGGTIEATSAGPGRGSEFTLRLPLDRSLSKPAAAANGPSVPAPGRRRVLIVDDNEDAAESLRALLELKGHFAQVVHDGETALDVLRQSPAEVVLLDIGLPGMDGYEVARRIRAMHGGRRIHLAALTGWGQEKDRQRALTAGFDEHLIKPAEPALLEAILAGEHPPSGRSS